MPERLWTAGSCCWATSSRGDWSWRRRQRWDRNRNCLKLAMMRRRKRLTRGKWGSDFGSEHWTSAESSRPRCFRQESKSDSRSSPSVRVTRCFQRRCRPRNVETIEWRTSASRRFCATPSTWRWGVTAQSAKCNLRKCFCCPEVFGFCLDEEQKQVAEGKVWGLRAVRRPSSGRRSSCRWRWTLLSLWSSSWSRSCRSGTKTIQHFFHVTDYIDSTKEIFC